MRGMRHPLTGAVYEMADGAVVVTHGDRRGVFDTRGRWLSGDRIEVSGQMCMWVGEGPVEPEDLATNRRFRGVVRRDPATGVSA